MSQHSSLKVASVGKRHRNVLKRHERVKKLILDEKWDDQKSIFGLPKVKCIKIKVKKVKEEKEGVEGEAGATPAGSETAEAAPKADKAKAAAPKASKKEAK
jgi:small basic protein (TIGR04137 family)